jgi:putative ABC transport system permease protein
VWVEQQAIGYAFASAFSNAPRSGRALRYIIRDSWRGLRSAPGATAFILLILTLGIAASTVTFSVVDTVVLRQLPFERSEELVRLSGRSPREAYAMVAPQEFLAWRDATDAFTGVAAVSWGGVAVPVGGDVEDVRWARATPNLFEVLGVHPLIGAAFSSEAERAGADRVALIGFGIWQRRFAGDPGAVGQMLQIGDDRVRIVGVMPAGFSYPIGPEPVEVWTPYVMTDEERSPNARGLSRYVNVVGRMRPGVSVEQARARIEGTMTALRAAQPKAYVDWRPQVTALYDSLVGDVRGWMLLVLGTVGLVMLVACINVANLLLTRSTYRARELAIRASLGASRRQIGISLLAESLIVALVAAGLGIVLAVWGIDAAKAALPAGLARASDIALDLRVLSAAIAGAVATGLLFGAVPAWQASRTDLVVLLKDNATTVTAGRRAWRSSFLVLEVAFVGVLLVVTTLFVSSFIRVTTADLGFDRSHLVAVPPQGFRGNFTDIVQVLRRVPGVASAAALAQGSPPLIAAGFGGGSSTTTLQRPDAPEGAEPLTVESRRVSPEYFETAGIRFVRGRVFNASGQSEGLSVVLDELAARELFGDRDPVGVVVHGRGPKDLYTVTGVVANVRISGPERSSGPEAYYSPLPSGLGGAPQFILRTTLPAASILPDLKAALAPFQPAGQPPAKVYAVDEAFRRITADRRFNAGLMSIFGVFALFIGGAGIYGVMASVVAQQTREFGVRVALGATARQIRETVLTQAGRYLLAGLAMGLAGAWWISKIFSSLLFSVHPTDAFVYVVVAVAVLAVGLGAALIPARRAARVDPIVSLRN